MQKVQQWVVWPEEKVWQQTSEVGSTEVFVGRVRPSAIHQTGHLTPHHTPQMGPPSRIASHMWIVSFFLKKKKKKNWIVGPEFLDAICLTDVRSGCISACTFTANISSAFYTTIPASFESGFPS